MIVGIVIDLLISNINQNNYLYGVDDGYTPPHETTTRTILWTLTLLLINVRPLCTYEGIVLVHLIFFDG